MIDRNIGLGERLVRLVLGLGLIAWVLGGASFGLPQVIALICAFALLWNSIFGRCYLWKWLGISTCDPEEDADCPGGAGSGNGSQGA